MASRILTAKVCALHPSAGRRNYKCIECSRLNAKKWNSEHKEIVTQRNKTYQIENREKIAKRKKLRYEQNKDTRLERTRSYMMKSKYGITLDDYRKMYEQQNGVCLICTKAETQQSNPKSAGPDSLRVDHCHTTNKVRGLLCSSCNFGISKFRDNPLLMLRAAAYVQGWQDLLFEETKTGDSE